MKATIEITDGVSSIKLTAENEFERTLIEDFEKESKNKEVECKARTDSEMYGNAKKNHRIYIDIHDKPKQK